MTDTSLVLARMAQALDLLSFLAWLPAAAAATVVLRVTWLRLTALELRIDRGLIPVALPLDWPVGPVAPYGPRTRRAAYPDAMRRGLFLASALVVGGLLLCLGLARFQPPHGPAMWSHGGPVIDFPQPDPAVVPQSPPGARPNPPLPQLPSALVQPSRETSSDSLDAIFDESLQTTSRYDGRGPNWGVGPTFGKNDGPPGPEGVPTEAEPDPRAFVPVDELPILVSMPVPRYPEMARQASLEGQVVLRLLVGRSGRVEKILVVESIPALDETARLAAAEARFKPAAWRGQPVPVWVTLPMRFALDDAH